MDSRYRMEVYKRDGKGRGKWVYSFHVEDHASISNVRLGFPSLDHCYALFECTPDGEIERDPYRPEERK